MVQVNRENEKFFLSLVKSKEIIVTRKGQIYNKHEQEIGYNNNGYREINKRNKNRKKFKILVHRLIWLVYRGEIPDSIEVNHIDGNKLNNELKNLELVTHRENSLHYHANAKPRVSSQAGHKNAFSKLTRAKVEEIRKLYSQGELNQTEIGKLFKVGSHTISNIVNNKTYIYTDEFFPEVEKPIPKINKPITKRSEVKGKYAKNEKEFLRLVEQGLLRLNKKGDVYNSQTENWIGHKNADGYCAIIIKGLDGKKRTITISRLMAYIFIGPIGIKKVVNHIDGCKTNNNIKNLEIVTARENNLHAEKMGLINHSKLKGHDHPNKKLSPDQEKEILKLYEKGETPVELGEKFKVSKSTIMSSIPKEISKIKSKKKLNFEKAQKIRLLYKKGYTRNGLKDMYAVTIDSIDNILNNKTYII